MEIPNSAALGGVELSFTQSEQIQSEQIDASYGASLTSDLSLFEQSLQKALESAAVEPGAEVARAVFEPLEYINNEATQLMEYAKSAVESGDDLTPSEIVMLTVKSQEFMFHSQLTSNIANRTADGIQQLFRQQS